MKIIVTQEILDMNPELGSLGIEIGAEVDVYLSGVPLTNEAPSQTLEDDPEPPPTGEDRPKKPPIRP